MSVPNADLEICVCRTLRHHSRQRLITESNTVKAAHDLQHGEIVGHVELVHGIGSVEDEVESEVVRLVPLVASGDDELFGAHLQRILLLVGAVAEDVDLSSKSSGEHDGEVAETANTDDTDLLAWSGA